MSAPRPLHRLPSSGADGFQSAAGEPVTDPGRSQPFESLYRDPTVVPGHRHRITARHYEPSLTPPEGEPASGDTYGWLYRDDPDAADTVVSGLRPSRLEPINPATEHAPSAAGDAPPSDSRRRSNAGLVVAAVVTLLVVVLALTAGGLSWFIAP